MDVQWSNCSGSTPVFHQSHRNTMGNTDIRQAKVNTTLGMWVPPELYPPQVTGSGRFSQPTPYYDLGINIINALEGYSSW